MTDEDTTSSLQILTERAEQLQKWEQLEKLEKLSIENYNLHRQLARCQQLWCATIELVQKSCEVLSSLKAGLQRHVAEGANAEQYLLEFKGLSGQNSFHAKDKRAGWI